MIYIFLFSLSFILTYVIKNYAIKKSFIDIPNDRSSHTLPVPHGGGIAIAVTWFLGISYQYYIYNIDEKLYFALMMGIVISTVSYFDDIFELSAKFRFLFQALVSCVGLYFLGGFESFSFFFFSIESPIVTNIFAFTMMIWFINLYNFLDGIDGYAGSEAVFLGLAGFLLFGENHFLILIFSAFGFLVWNWHKAKIFMGDVGSTLLGYNIAIFTIYYANLESTNFWIWIILFGVFWFDATLTLLRRFLSGEEVTIAHKKHAYQRLVQSGWSHDKVVLFFMFVNILLFGLLYFISSILIVLIISIILLYTTIRFVDKIKAFK